nr:molecular chaperone TorD family protein [Halomonas gemina]
MTLAEARGPLLEDLTCLAASLPSIDSERLAALSAAFAALTDTQRLILGYSRLFLAPPAPAPLNLGAYLDGGLMARSVSHMEALYCRHGLERDPAFRDLPDHLALNLQWLAWVYSEAEEAREAGADARAALTDAASMLEELTLPALAGIRRKVIAADVDATTRPWRLLVELTHDQLSRDLAHLRAALPEPAREEPRSSLSGPAADAAIATFEHSDAPRERLSCRACGRGFESDPVLAEMRRRLLAAGVDADHLAVCPGCRDDNSAIPRHRCAP